VGNYSLEPFRQQFGVATVPPDPSEPHAELMFAAQFIRYARKPARPSMSGGKHQVSTDLVDHEVLVCFDLRWPSAGEVAGARRLLTDRANFRFRFRPDKFSTYLRLLDAREAEATNSQVAKLIYPHLSDVHPNFDGTRQVRADRNVAEVLRDG